MHYRQEPISISANCRLECRDRQRYGVSVFELDPCQLAQVSAPAECGGDSQTHSAADSRANAEDESVMAKIVFVRDRSKKKWLALLSTDVELADEQIIAFYKRRWDIEVFFKITKSYLNLAKEFQSRSYDALVAHTSIVFARYIMLALARRSTKDPRTLGSLFHAGCDELRQVSFAEALMLLLDHLEQLVKSFAEMVTAPIRAMLETFMEQIPGLLRRSLLLPACKF